jgi:hypothetical protein
MPLGTPLAFQVVQYGFSPANETAGLGALSYDPVPAVSDEAIKVSASAAAAVVNAAGGGRGSSSSSSSSSSSLVRRALSAASAAITAAMNVAVAAQGGTTASGASQTALLTAAPRPAAALDLLPARPMDSRTIVPSVLLPGGRSAGALVLPVAFQLVIPLRDLSIVQWDAARGAVVTAGGGQQALQW